MDKQQAVSICYVSHFGMLSLPATIKSEGLVTEIPDPKNVSSGQIIIFHQPRFP